MKHLYPKTPIRSPFNDWTKPVSLPAISVRSLILCVCLFFVANLKAQYSPGNPGKFGIDGDVYSDARQQGNFAAAGSHDWFYTKNGSGMGMFDTSDSSSIKVFG